MIGLLFGSETWTNKTGSLRNIDNVKVLYDSYTAIIEYKTNYYSVATNGRSKIHDCSRPIIRLMTPERKEPPQRPRKSKSLSDCTCVPCTNLLLQSQNFPLGVWGTGCSDGRRKATRIFFYYFFFNFRRWLSGFSSRSGGIFAQVFSFPRIAVCLAIN